MIHSLKQRQKDRPLMGFLFYDSPHAGDYPPEFERFTPALKTVNHLELNNSYDRTPYFNRFRNAVYYCDALIGEVVQALKEQAMLENTVLIVTGDHGEEFNELKNNYWGHNGSFSRYQVQVPLLIRWPGGEAKAFDHMSSHLDLAPTLLRKIFALHNDPQDYSNGRDLADSSPRDFVLASNWTNFAIIEPTRTTVVFPAGQMESYRNEDYRLLDNETLSPGLATRVMQDMSRFLAR
jgi:membrane-anchored protein YejM (alkaline phosphatase superfamily)